jgi:hypothetical protein
VDAVRFHNGAVKYRVDVTRVDRFLLHCPAESSSNRAKPHYGGHSLPKLSCHLDLESSIQP